MPVLIGLALAFSLIYYISIARIGPVDHGAIITGYLRLLFMSAAYIAIGIYASSLTRNQIVAFLVALLVGVFFHIIFQVAAPNFTGLIGEVLNFLSTGTHFDSMSGGVIDSRDLLFFGSLDDQQNCSMK